LEVEALKRILRNESRFLSIIWGMVILRIGWDLWYFIDPLSFPLVHVASVILHLVGALLIISAFFGDEARKKLNRIVLLFGVVTVLLTMSAVNVMRFRVGSDAILFVRYAVDLLLRGENPYVHSMLPAFEKYSAFINWVTYTQSGELVSFYIYPALSFLLYTPAVLLGVIDINTVTIAFLVATVFLLLYETPKEMRSFVSIAILANPRLIALTAGGIFDIVWIFFLILAIRWWKRSWHLSAIFYGLACSVKQIPWFIAPFMLVAYWRRGEPRVAFKYFTTAALVFFALNLPFIVGAPEVWISRILAPILIPMMIYGQGVSSLSFTGILILPKEVYDTLQVSTFLILLILYHRYYSRKIEGLLWVLPVIVFFFGYRSLESYIISFVPIALYVLVKEVGEEWAKA